LYDGIVNDLAAPGVLGAAITGYTVGMFAAARRRCTWIEPGADLLQECAANPAAATTWGEPPDYFDHVMLANGRCQAPEPVAVSRTFGRDLVPADLQRGYPPSVRFYFRWHMLAVRPDAVFDVAASVSGDTQFT
jgi:hypothetical protein